MKKFLKSTEVQLVSGGYLSHGEGVNPINNEEFVKAQKHAEYIVTFAKLSEGKDFKGKKADSIADLKAAVAKELATKDTEYVLAPKEVKRKLTDQLAEEAKAWMKFEDETSNVKKINTFLQQFNIVKEFEDFGLFFDDGIVKLNKLYTMEDIVSSVKKVINLLD